MKRVEDEWTGKTSLVMLLLSQVSMYTQNGVSVILE